MRRTLLFLLWVAILPGQDTPSGENCTFRNDPDEYLQRMSRERAALTAQTSKLAAARFATAAGGLTERGVAAQDIPRRNFIDIEIFDRLTKEGVASARVTTDEEFVRRLYLDLTGRLPGASDVRKFVEDEAVRVLGHAALDPLPAENTDVVVEERQAQKLSGSPGQPIHFGPWAFRARDNTR